MNDDEIIKDPVLMDPLATIGLRIARHIGSDVAPTDDTNTFLYRPQTDEDLKEFVFQKFHVRLPDKRVCPEHQTPFEAFRASYFATAPVTIWKASRGFGGKTYLLSLLTAIEAITLPADVTLLAGSGEQSQRVHEAMQRLWAMPNAPRHYLLGDPSKVETIFRWGNRVRALKASQRSVRGPHPQRLRFDECDEADINIIDAALGQTMAGAGIRAQTTLSSTHQYADKAMTELLRRAPDKGWPVFTWCWKETAEPHGWLMGEEVERKRVEITDRMWKTEYDLQEPSTEGRAMNPDKVEECFKPSLGTWAGRLNELIVVEPPDEKGLYSTGCDWGRRLHWTVILTFRYDVRPPRLVAYERTARIDWPTIVKKFEDRVNAYGSSSGGALHDATGLGDVISGYLKIPHAEGIEMRGLARAELLNAHVLAVDNVEFLAPRIEWAFNQYKFCTVDDLHGSGHPPDSFVAGALAWKGVLDRAGLLSVPTGLGGTATGDRRRGQPPNRAWADLTVPSVRKAGEIGDTG